MIVAIYLQTWVWVWRPAGPVDDAWGAVAPSGYLWYDATWGTRGAVADGQG
jgi:hypothetical protein